ncbi:putative cytochrome P450 hydroxylase [Alloactinosynnema sp. L-07]|uniref:cytochrome P450 n=1 Tax=Alloactinosynnema sp. L-07 TaxID=1653480 RepID=UPI00065F01A0|nr:cytochrome P450 [Alloactinosynnema sp. L-07]CRK56748.1 putative cytochrome P450 hydroxylase [Alloactinosynnema sp. L-07]
MKLTRPTGQEPIDLDTVDLVDPALHGEGDPHAIWHAMRERDPVHWQWVAPGLGFWSATKFDHVTRVLRDHHVFTSEHGTLLNLLGKKDPASGQQLPATDPPKHTRMRSPIQRALNGKILEWKRESIRQEIKTLLAEVVDGEPFDFAELTGKIPMAVTGTLMGLDREDWPRLTYLTSQAIAPDDPEFIRPEGGKATLQRAHRELFASFEDSVARRKGDGDGDLIDILRTMELEDGRKLRQGEIVSNCYSLLLGANVTTPHVPNAAIVELMDDGKYADWADHPELLDSGIEEALRWSSPASHFMRYAKVDVQLGATTIKAGEPVAAWLGSANRDSDVFPDPYRFDVRRTPAERNLAFGVGPHYCVGHAVARISLREFFEELFDQFDGFESGGEPEHLHSNFIAGMKHLPLVATRRSAVRG